MGKSSEQSQMRAVQVLAQNAVLARALLEGVGAFARALGHRFAAGGRLMYTVLIPLLERLADPCPSVASSAAAAVGSLCLHSGYSGLEDLVPFASPCTLACDDIYRGCVTC